MGAGKSLDLLKVAYNYYERGMNAILFNSDLDRRFGNDAIVSRTGINKDAISYSIDTDFLQYMLENFINKNTSVNCVLVDEAQFLLKAQVQQLRQFVTRYNIPVICYGLRTDFRADLFEGSMWLMAWADTIEELKTVCWCGKKATMNARVVDGQVIKEGKQIQIGGNESYVALCQSHFSEGVASDRK